MAAAARATAAAPTYFEPSKLEAEGTVDYFSLVDGGVFATNPAMCAFAEVRRHRPADEVVLLSLGTGQLTRSLPYDEVKDWGLVEWARPILDVVFDGVSDTVTTSSSQLLAGGGYWRLQVALDGGASDDLDDAEPREPAPAQAQGRGAGGRLEARAGRGGGGGRRLEREVDGAPGVQPGRVEDRHGRIVLPDQQVDLGAAEEDALGAAVGESRHDPPVLLAASRRRPRRGTARRRSRRGRSRGPPRSGTSTSRPCSSRSRPT